MMPEEHTEINCYSYKKKRNKYKRKQGREFPLGFPYRPACAPERVLDVLLNS